MYYLYRILNNNNPLPLDSVTAETHPHDPVNPPEAMFPAIASLSYSISFLKKASASQFSRLTL